ncbi:hypothetical protein NEAUS06_0879 [Nematocida ausubeli]|nr:hypothetical protein NEAUS06_0879 [Nematocida ausubeli]
MKAKRLSIFHNGDSQDGYLMETQNTSLLFDPPSVVLDKNIEIGSILDRKYIEIEVIKEYPPNIAGIFITNSNALSVFFIESNITIYLTDYIYLQMKERLKYYRSLGPVSQCTSVPQAHTKIVSVAEYKDISKRIKIIRNNQIINFTYLSITARAAGTSLGWVMYDIAQGREKICAYTYGIPGGSSLSHEMKPQNQPTPLFVNQFRAASALTIQDLSKAVTTLSNSKESFVITMDVLSHSVEMALHILSLVKTRNIYVVHPGFKRIMQLYEMKRDVFAEKFVSEPSIISTLFTTPRLKPSSLFKASKTMASESIIILCEPTFYKLFYKSMPAIHLSDYGIKFTGCMEDVLKLPWISQLCLNKLKKDCAIEEKISVPVEDVTEEGLLIAESALFSIHLHNTHNINVVSKSKEGLSLHFAGDFKKDLIGLSLDCKESKLQNILSHNAASRLVVNSTLVCPVEDAVFKIKEEGGIVSVKKEQLPRN